jgi:hypothetical protein
MSTACLVIGITLLCLWAVYLPITRVYVRQYGNIMLPTLFQYNFIPFIVGVAMITTREMRWFALGIVGWLCAPAFGRSSVFVLPVLSGAVVGARLASPYVWESAWWLVGGPVLGAIAAMSLGSFVFAAVGIDRVGK